ncbi:glycosyl hydrolase family 28-related protein [Sediminicoccus sp. KRV36]|uniref:glycosyl hydrolase family 28-related protein n=1 Tax=Sediminicoccus sp. KRV36 TaxID=3133721 RepID=UPI00200E56DE|nr:glycosyl hydrolase family 28-related protein [Sediminicoccus rosea]UPY36610.1 hydrolase [Sediminicoccus rosea]
MSEHIRIGDIAPRVHYVADGVQTAFTYPFPIFEPGDIEVLGNNAPANYGFTIEGAGQSGGGTIRYAAPPPAGTRLTILRRLTVERVTDFQSNGVLRAMTLNDELDRQVAALQEVRDDVQGAIRLDDSEAPGGMVLPLREARAEKLLGFDAVGDVMTYDRSGTIAAAFPGSVPRSVEDKLAENLTARDFGTVGDGVTDDGPALQAAMNAAGSASKHLVIGEGTFRTSMPLLLPGGAVGLTMRGSILYAGPAGQAALTMGDGGAVRNAAKLYQGLRVIRATQSDWQDFGDIGIVMRNLDSSNVEIRQVEGFTIGIQTLGVERGFEDSNIFLGRIVNNQIGLDIHTQTAAAWNTSVRYHGGHFAIASALHPTLSRYGIRFSAEPGAYVAHNRHVFFGPAFELQARDRPAIFGVPFLCEVSSRAVIAYGMRMEGCSPHPARHTGNAQDHVYEVAWASQAYLLEVSYDTSSARVGSVVRGLHQAAAHREFTRQIGSVPNLRAAAFRWNASQTGFDQLACLSTNVSGSPSTLADFAFPGLEDYALSNRGVVLTGGRGLGFVVDSTRAREFALAVDADNPRLIVQCFDAAMNLLGNGSGQLVRASGMSMLWNSDARWWQGSADMTDADLTRLQVVRLEPGVAFAIIGVARIGVDYEVRAMRLFSDPAVSPPLLYGLPDLRHGARELRAEAAWDPPSIAAGGTTQINVALNGARPGDFVQAAFTLSTSGIVFLAQIGAQDVVTVTAWNRSGAAVDLGAGTVRVRLVKS